MALQEFISSRWQVESSIHFSYLYTRYRPYRWTKILATSGRNTCMYLANAKKATTHVTDMRQLRIAQELAQGSSTWLYLTALRRCL